MEKGESWKPWEGAAGEPRLGEEEAKEGMLDSPCLPGLHGVMQGRQWDLAHNEKDHLRALISGQRAGKRACGKKMVERGGPGEASGRQRLSAQAFR